MKNPSQCGSTQGSLCIERTTRETIEQVRLEEKKMETQEVSMEEGEGKDTDRDTQMPEASEPPEAQRKRIGEKPSGSIERSPRPIGIPWKHH
jgi:hypothetical protein